MTNEYCRRSFVKTILKVGTGVIVMPQTLVKDYVNSISVNNNIQLNPNNDLALVEKPKLITAPSIIIPKHKLTIYNTHTGEWLKKVEIPLTGEFSKELKKKIERIFIDHRSNAVHPIDKRLIRLLINIMKRIDSHKPIHLVSGYRSNESNAYLHETSYGVAKESYHTRGMAADLFLEGVSNQRIQKIALQEKKGGVGRYKQFVHIDTGRVRRWGLLLGC